MKLNQLPNLITLARILLLFPLVWLIVQRQYSPALVVFVIAGLSDGLDGLLAKRFNWVSRLGSILDPLADKLLMLVSYTLLTQQDYLPLWLLLLVVARDLLIVGGASIFYRLFGPFDMAPSWLSKFNTAFQILLVTLVMSSLVFTQIPHFLSVWLIGVVATLSFASGIHYSWTWGGELRRRLKHKHHTGARREAEHADE